MTILPANAILNRLRVLLPYLLAALLPGGFLFALVVWLHQHYGKERPR